MSCTGKPKFKTESEVQKALKNTSTVPAIKSFYLCTECGNHHLGDKPQPRPARRIRKNSHTARR
jgi:hypothetical protein